MEVGSFHIFREIELSFVIASSVDINWETREDTFSLPVSKTDPRAVGCTRTWGCVCDGQHSSPCAFLAMIDQLEFLENKFLGVAFVDLPLFFFVKMDERRRRSMSSDLCAMS